ncbi:cysteine hydrolase family protein [Vibrio quintilis]|uniref:Streptothricin hydrolase n=1 Tax=Vibrio quintilis TaxID=1117707 RepID=A0A1M7YRH6_9VIBR|nr:cysteine hydrolase family protein [Vibrio quintilis]SHO55208.1 Streptothricin hydrolase [Vibrio quintilis]
MKSAVVVIDVQRILFEGDPLPYAAGEVIQHINQITAKARHSQVPVIFVQHEAPETEIEYGSEGWQLQSDLKVAETDILIRKTTPDSFLNTNLQNVLSADDVTNLLVCGYATEYCVDSTVRRAAALGYSVQLVEDTHTTHDKDHATGQQIRAHHNATLPDLTSFPGKITLISAADVEFS